MSQHDYNIANAGGAAVRSDMNNALAAIQSLNSGATAPTATVAGMLWYDTATSTLKQRNGTNTDWVAAADLIGGGGQIAGLRNKIINGSMEVDQRNSGAAQTITAAAALAYTIDRWYAYCTGANVTGQRVAGVAPNRFNYRFTGAASVTKIGFSQRIEAANCQDLAGTTATLSVDLANSVLTTVTWTAWYANTADTFGTLASPTRTQIATGTFTVSSTLSRYSTQISVPAAATTGIEVEFSVAAQTSGTWTIGESQLEVGGVPTQFERRPIGMELALCQRYFVKLGGQSAYDILAQSYVAAGSNLALTLTLPVTMRASPTTTKVGTWTATNSSQPVSSGNSTTNISINSTASASGATQFSTLDTTTYLTCSAEL